MESSNVKQIYLDYPLDIWRKFDIIEKHIDKSETFDQAYACFTWLESLNKIKESSKNCSEKFKTYKYNNEYTKRYIFLIDKCIEKQRVHIGNYYIKNY